MGSSFVTFFIHKIYHYTRKVYQINRKKIIFRDGTIIEWNNKHTSYNYWGNLLESRNLQTDKK